MCLAFWPQARFRTHWVTPIPDPVPAQADAGSCTSIARRRQRRTGEASHDEPPATPATTGCVVNPICGEVCCFKRLQQNGKGRDDANCRKVFRDSDLRACGLSWGGPHGAETSGAERDKRGISGCVTTCPVHMRRSGGGAVAWKTSRNLRKNSRSPVQERQHPRTAVRGHFRQRLLLSSQETGGNMTVGKRVCA